MSNTNAHIYTKHSGTHQSTIMGTFTLGGGECVARLNESFSMYADVGKHAVPQFIIINIWSSMRSH